MEDEKSVGLPNLSSPSSWNVRAPRASSRARTLPLKLALPFPLPAPLLSFGMTQRIWRRASTVNRAGEPVPISDDWLLFDAYEQPLGRITRQRSGPVASKWNWYVFVNGDGYAAGVSGMADDGPKAKAEVEQRIPPGVYHRDAKQNGDREFRRQRAVARRKGKL